VLKDPHISLGCDNLIFRHLRHFYAANLLIKLHCSIGRIYAQSARSIIVHQDTVSWPVGLPELTSVSILYIALGLQRSVVIYISTSQKSSSENPYISFWTKMYVSMKRNRLEELCYVITVSLVISVSGQSLNVTTRTTTRPAVPISPPRPTSPGILGNPSGRTSSQDCEYTLLYYTLSTNHKY